MNWKKFMAEYQEVREWLERQGAADAGACMLKILALLLTGHRKPSDILYRAVHTGSLRNILAEPLAEVKQEFVVPADIQKLLLHWAVTLPAQDVTLLGEIHERTCLARKTQGVYYTPKPIVDFIMDHTLACLDVIQNPDAKILDPACGCGFFFG
jgi:adenine-specific DNA-methyltransferase